MAEARRGKGRPRAFDRETALRRALEVFWSKGFEPTKIMDLCHAMGLSPPSLYATFGNKTRLFLEAVDYYETTYWDAPSRQFLAEPDVFRATEDFFRAAAHILRAPDTPCGCLVVLAAINISPDETAVVDAIQSRRMATKAMFAQRFEQARKDGQFPSDTDIEALAGAFNTILEGLSIQARDGLAVEELERMAMLAVRMLPQGTARS